MSLRSLVFQVALTLLLFAFIFVLYAADDYSIQQYLNIRGNFSGGFIPNSSDIMFMNKSTGVYQAWRVSDEGGWAHQVTCFEEGIDYYIIHPITWQMIVASDEGGNERSQLWICDTWGGNLEPLVVNPKAKHGVAGWSRDGKWFAYQSNERNEADFDIYLMNLATRDVECVWKKGGYWDGMGFSPDGKYLMLANYSANDNGDLYLYNIESSANT